MKKFSYLVDILHNKTIKYKKMNVLNELINDESKLNERISASLDRELSRQKLAGKEFISDDADTDAYVAEVKNDYKND